MRPNVLLVILDAARRDALEPYGAAAGSTPAIAQLASRGVALSDVYATACWTVPSHASIFTGLMPRAAGLAQANSPSGCKPLLEAHRERLLPELLRRAGYATGALSANLWLSPTSGFDTGFDDFVSLDTDRGTRLGDDLRSRVRWLSEAARARVDDGAAAAARTLRQWVADGPRQPFFWFVNLIECHSPYLPPRPYGDVSLLERLRAADDARRYYKVDAIWRSCVGGFDMPEPAVDRMRRLYAASIRYMDDWLAQLLTQLDETGMLDDTLVLVTSDHGENLGEGGLVAHGLSLDNRLIHVPLVAAGPGAADARLESLASIPRVIAEAVGLEEHPWHDGPPSGVGVAQFDPPAEPGDPKAIEAVRSWGLGESALERLTTPLTCAVAGGLKLQVRGDREEVYDLESDPLELTPLPPGAVPEERLAPLRDALAHPSVTAGGPEAAAAAAAQPSADELREIEERMKLLGYM
jgi:arylsulfatase A-like enzyme